MPYHGLPIAPTVAPNVQDNSTVNIHRDGVDTPDQQGAENGQNGQNAPVTSDLLGAHKPRKGANVKLPGDERAAKWSSEETTLQTNGEYEAL